MAREEGLSELTVDGASFKLEPVSAPPDKSAAEEEVEPIEAMGRDLEQEFGVPVDRAALRDFLGNCNPPAKKGRTNVA